MMGSLLGLRMQFNSRHRYGQPFSGKTETELGYLRPTLGNKPA